MFSDDSGDMNGDEDGICQVTDRFSYLIKKKLVSLLNMYDGWINNIFISSTYLAIYLPTYLSITSLSRVVDLLLRCCCCGIDAL